MVGLGQYWLLHYLRPFLWRYLIATGPSEKHVLRPVLLVSRELESVDQTATRLQTPSVGMVAS